MRLDSDFLVNIPLARLDQLDCPAVHLRVDDGDGLLRVADELDWSRIEEVTLPDLDTYAALARHHNRCRWNLRWSDFDVDRLLDLQKVLRRATVTLLVAPDDDALYDKLLVGESLALLMRLDLGDPDAVDLGTLNELVTYVLITSATRNVRIEPLKSMMSTAAGGERRTLWDHAREDVRHHVWVSDDGRLSLSERLVESDTYTTLEQLSQTDFARSEAFKRLDDYKERLFRDQTECSICQAFPLCGGWLRYADSAYDCEVWQLVLNGLAEAVGDRQRARVLNPTS